MNQARKTDARILEIEGTFSDGVLYLAHVTAPTEHYDSSLLALRLYTDKYDFDGRKATDDEIAVYGPEVSAYVDTLGNR